MMRAYVVPSAIAFVAGLAIAVTGQLAHWSEGLVEGLALGALCLILVVSLLTDPDLARGPRPRPHGR